MERINEEELKTHLMQTDEQFRQLQQQHCEYDRILTELESRLHLTHQEMLEEIRLKKLKLQAKDQMTEILSRYRTQAV